MSSPETNSDPRRVQQTLTDYSDAHRQFPQNFVPKTNPYNQNERALFGDRELVEFVQVKFHRSAWFLNNPRENFLDPTQKLVLVSWEKDKHLLGREPEDEFTRLEKLQDVVDIYFPGDRWTYEVGMRSREVLKEIERSVESQIELKQMVDDADLPIMLYPVITGWERWHYEHNRKLFTVFDTDTCGFDGTGYNSKPKLIKDLHRLVDTLGPERIYLNGRIARDWLHDVPREVVAFSGIHSLLNEAQLPNGEHSHELLAEGIKKREKALNNIQSELVEFTAEGITGD